MKRAVAAAVTVVGLLAGCSASAGSAGEATRAGWSGTPRTSAADPMPTAPTTDRLIAAAKLAQCPRVGTAVQGTPGPAAGLPRLVLGCLGAGPAVAVSALRGPAVVNLWASWCPPCRAEMPQLQSLHARAGTRLLVLGVVTDDSRRSALSAAAALGVHYPSVLDTKGALRRAYGYPGPPVTLFLDASGAVVSRIIGPLPPLAELLTMVSRRLGVSV